MLENLKTIVSLLKTNLFSLFLSPLLLEGFIPSAGFLSLTSLDLDKNFKIAFLEITEDE